MTPALSVDAIAAELACSRTHVINLIQGSVKDTPKLPAVKTGRLYRIRRDTFDRWLAQMEGQAS